ncbi:hypothetical protein ACKC9G_02900 [Pokkaliibacter sp. CJK22405]|uniref:hypothetical protein n=1 Tax=Pokkaliibacter sp. CJK22405 TaxID=3384615 RepID=UPI00398479CB
MAIFLVLNVGLAVWGYQREESVTNKGGELLQRKSSNRLSLASEVETAKQDGMKLCNALEFASRIQMEKWLGWLSSQKIPAESMQSESATTEYWVYYQPGEESSESVSAKLKAKKLPAQIIVSGRYQGYVSLGRYTIRALAEEMVQQAKSAGVRVKSYPLVTTVRRWQILLPSTTAKQWRQQISSLTIPEQSELRINKILCK